MVEQSGGNFSPLERALLFAGRECTVIAAHFSLGPAMDISTQLVSPENQAQATDALSDFIEALYSIPRVDAVSFLAVDYPDSPTTLSTVVFTPLRRNDKEAARAVDSITTAEAQFAHRIFPILHTGLRFANTVSAGIESAKSRLMHRWIEDESVELLRFVNFQRG